MYEVGRESVKEHPSSLLMVVCYYYNGGAAQVEVEPTVVVRRTPQKEDFTHEGVLDKRAFAAAVRTALQERATDGPGSGDGMRVSRVHTAIARFLQQRITEASVADAMHLMPDDVPWNRQPAWKWRLWNRYWSGASDERDAEHKRMMARR